MRSGILKSGKVLAMALGIMFMASQAMAELNIESVFPTLGKMGEDLPVEITGNGFVYGDTRLSMYLDTMNRKMVLSEVHTDDRAIDITVVGNMAYVAAGQDGLVIIDISNPAKPEVRGKLTGNYATGIAVDESLAYVVNLWDGLKIIDVINPDKPILKGTVNTSFNGNDIKISGQKAYVATSGDGGFLEVFDISNPSAPQPIGSPLSLTEPAHGLALSGNLAFIVTGFEYYQDTSGGLKIVDISDSSNLQIIGQKDTPGNAYGIFLAGNLAYIADGDNGLTIIDVTNSSSPQFVSNADTGGFAANVWVANNIAYIADGYNGLQMIDVSNPNSPQRIGSLNIDGCSSGIFMDGELVYLTDAMYNGMPPGKKRSLSVRGPYGDVYGWVRIINMGVPVNPVSINTLDSPRYASDVAVSGNLAYVANGKDGLQIIDMSNPSDFKVRGNFPTQDTYDYYAQRVFLSGNRAYITCANEYNNYRNPWVVDISNPDQPKGIGRIAENAKSMVVQNSLAYITYCDYYDCGIKIMDITNPENPSTISTLYTAGEAFDIAVSSGIAYVADGYSGVQLIDVQDPWNPQPIGTIDTPGTASGIAIVGNIAYIADGYNGLLVMDIIETGSLPTTTTTASVMTTTSDSETTTTLEPIMPGKRDITNPQAVIIANIATPGFAKDVAISDNKAYVAILDVEVVILPLPVEIPLTSQQVGSNRITATLPQPRIEGHYILRVFNQTEGSELLGGVTFSKSEDVQIQRQNKAIIVAGGPTTINNPLWQPTRTCSHFAYMTLMRHRGYLKENIRFLSPENADVDGNGIADDIAGDATKADLSFAISTWAQDAYDLLIYITGHAGPVGFRINSDELVKPTEIGSLLNSLQDTIPGKVIFIMDACFSGSFISAILPPTLKERIIMTSTNSDEEAAYGDQGHISFSYQFWSQIRRGNSLMSTFTVAKDFMGFIQTAQINPISLSDQLQVGIGYTPASDIPKISQVVCPSQLNGETTAKIQARSVIDANGIDRVHAYIVPPNFNAEGSPIFLPYVQLIDLDGDDTYEANYNGFSASGDYRIVVYARDKQGIESDPFHVQVTQLQGTSTATAGDINGADGVNLMDAIISLKVNAGMNAQRLIRTNYPTSGADVSGNEKAGLEEAIFVLQKVAGLR